jgi:hypothetical protein
MLKHPLHTLLLLIFALLQCAAPLVHAHVNGEHTGIIPPALAAPHVQDELTQTDCAIETDESPAISLSTELQRNNVPALPQPSWTYTAETRAASTVKFRTPSPHPASFFSPYSKSHPQAPPALS